jgi:hypothetical protein
MAASERLTELLRGRRIQGTHIAIDTLRVDFDDGSVMHIRIGGPWSPAVMGIPVKAVRQQL